MSLQEDITTVAGISNVGRRWNSSCQHQGREKEQKGYEYWLLRLMPREELIPTTVWGGKRGRVSPVIALWYSMDVASNNLQKSVEMLWVHSKRRILLFLL